MPLLQSGNYLPALSLPFWKAKPTTKMVTPNKASWIAVVTACEPNPSFAIVLVFSFLCPLLRQCRWKGFIYIVQDKLNKNSFLSFFTLVYPLFTSSQKGVNFRNNKNKWYSRSQKDKRTYRSHHFFLFTHQFFLFALFPVPKQMKQLSFYPLR